MHGRMITIAQAPLIEFVGWTVLSGLQEVTPGNNQSAKGDTIVNMKVGMVFALGDYISREGLPPLNDRLNLSWDTAEP